jgi:hypothetical protein
MLPLEEESGQDGLRRLAKTHRWSVRLGTGPLRRLETRSFLGFSKLMPCREYQIARIITLLRETQDGDTEERARLALLLHVFLLYRMAKAVLPARRGSWERLERELIPVLATIRPTAPPVTLWLLAHYRLPLRERKWPLLEQRLAAFAARPPHDEIGMLACWMAARELLALAIKERDSSRVTQALRHYKLYISGRHAHAVGRGPLSAIVEQDLLRLARDFPEFLEHEMHERGFIEDWLLARFSMWTALRIALMGRSWRERTHWTVLGAVMAAAVVITCSLGPLPWAPLKMLGKHHLLVAPFVLALVAVLWCAAPRAARVFYPRLFAGAILGWSTVLGELATHRLFVEETAGPLVADFLCHGEAHPGFLILIVVPWFFLYQEVQAAIGDKRQAFTRSIIMLGWAAFLVAFVGNAAAAALERVVCGAWAASTRGAFWLFVYGGVVSLYFTVVVHLVWGDEGMSATLAHTRSDRK